MRRFRLLALALCAAAGASMAADPPAAAPAKVVVSGTVPDEATRQAVLTRAREVFGADRVVDQLGVGDLVAPPNWSRRVQDLITPDLKQVSRGQLSIRGSQLEIRGEVANQSQRQSLESTLAERFGKPNEVRNYLKVTVSGQKDLDDVVRNRVVEFEPASATLTPAGQALLDELLPVMRQMTGRSFEIVGHTDAQGGRPQNIVLSQARADAVKTYLVARGLAPGTMSTAGMGPDRPVAPNDTPDGRARNRRIEFRVMR